MARDAKVVCQPCKARKVRCDGERPACNRCLRSDRNCAYESKRRGPSFRYSKFSSLAAPSPPHGPDPVGEQGQPEPPRLDRAPEHDALDEDLDGPIGSLGTFGTTLTPGVPQLAHEREPQLHSPEQIRDAGPSPVSLVSASAHASSHWSVPDPSASPRAVQGTRSAAALSPIDGELLHFYVSYVGPWLDVTSPERHYTYTVPRLALQSPLLLYAVLSCAARIHRVQNNSRPDFREAEDGYQHMCVRLLIPILDNVPSAVQDDVVLATIVILRMSEQHDEYDVDRQFHLVPGAFSHYKTPGPSSTAAGGLHEATFYSYVKSDIRMAILGRCCTRLSIDSWPLDNSDPRNDADWANRITWLLVQTINLCHGGPGILGLLPRDAIERYVDEWKQNLPETFEPYYFDEPETEPFPIIRLLAPWHIVGLQFYHATKILLATHPSPDTPFTDALHFNSQLQTVIIPHVRMLCAISFSNEHHGCRINASHLVAMGAQYLHGREERSRVDTYFKRLHEGRGWPSKMCLDMLNKPFI